MQQQLSDIIAQFEHAQRRVDRIGEAIPEDKWNIRSDPQRWSVSECIVHVNLTGDAYIPRIRKAIEEARQLPPFHGTYRRDFVGWLFAALVGPLPSIGRTRIGRVKTTPAFVPAHHQPKQTILAGFKRMQLELIAMVKESDGRAIDKTKIASPFGEKMSYNCYSTFTILPRHEERHIDQAEAVWR